MGLPGFEPGSQAPETRRLPGYPTTPFCFPLGGCPQSLDEEHRSKRKSKYLKIVLRQAFYNLSVCSKNGDRREDKK